jgi:hypothetical protein
VPTLNSAIAKRNTRRRKTADNGVSWKQWLSGRSILRRCPATGSTTVTTFDSVAARFFQTLVHENTNENAYQIAVMRYTMRREIIGMYAVPFGYSLKAS